MSAVDAASSFADAPAHPESSSSRRERLRRFFRRTRFWAIASLAAAALVAVGLRYRSSNRQPAVHYDTAVVDRGPVAAKVTATGALSALVTVSVGSQVSGRIERLFVDFGSVVRRGQTVATLDPAFFRAAVAQARANFLSARAAVDRARAQSIQARRNHARAAELATAGLASQADFESAEAEVGVAEAANQAADAGVEQARAALQQAELNLKYTTIASPIDGVVISRSVDVGQTVAAALYAPTLFLIAQDLTRMQVDTNVAEADIGKVRAGMPVTFTVDAYPQRSFRGMVRQVRDNAQTIQNVVTYDAVIDVDNTDHLLKPGMTASVTFVYATNDDALRLPNAAIRFKPDPATLAAMRSATAEPAARESNGSLRSDERLVWVRRGTTSGQVTVRAGISDGSSTEVLAGDLREGDEVVVEARPAGAPGGAK
jgi:HlyD family secretion protein